VPKLKGPFIWHKHDDTDDFFLVGSGSAPLFQRLGARTTTRREQRRRQYARRDIDPSSPPRAGHIVMGTLPDLPAKELL
jgi:hypothetical protein